MDDSAKNKQKNQEPDGRHGLALRAIRILEEAGYESRLAGGCVRDRLLGIKPKDYDVATRARPDEICTIFKQKGIKVVPTGMDHGTITVVMAGQGMEVTSLRRDVTTDGRRATVAFGSTFEEDAARRDFTFNAMFEDAKGQVYDYFGGQEDLKNGRLRFVGDPGDRIEEDYLRILRLFRFWARFGFAPEAPTLEACRQHVEGLRIVSQERITAELMQTLDGDYVVEPLQAMAATGVLDFILGLKEIPADRFAILDALKIGRKEERGAARLSVILGLNPTTLQNTLQNLRLSREMQQKTLLHSEVPLEHLSHDPAELLDHIDLWESLSGPFLDHLLPLWRVMYPQNKAQLDELEAVESRFGHKRRSKVPIDGKMLMTQFGLKPGPELGLLLQTLKKSWRLGGWQTVEQGIEQAKKILSTK